MRKWICLLLVVALLGVPTLAFAKGINTKLFSAAKQALTLLSYGETKSALKKLGLSSDADAVERLDTFVEENLADLMYVSVQTDVAVCYKVEKGYKFAVPLEAPEDRDVQTFVLKSKDGQSFGGYTAMTWGDVQRELADSDSIIWKDAYDPSASVIIADE